MHSRCFFHLILLDSITVVIFGEAHMLRSFLLCSLLQSASASSLLGSNIHLSTLFSQYNTLFKLN
jgi:hypothetical protein